MPGIVAQPMRAPRVRVVCHDPHMELTFLGGARTVTVVTFARALRLR